MSGARGAVSEAWSWRHAVVRSGLAPVTRHVLLTLSVYMNEAGQDCFPSIDDLVETTGLSKGAVIKHLAAAELAGWLGRRTHGFRGRKWRRTEYEPRWPGRGAAGAEGRADEPLGPAGDDAPEASGEGGGEGQGGARGEPPRGDEAVHVVNQGGARGEPEVVHEVNHVIETSPITSPETSPVERETRARDPDSGEGGAPSPTPSKRETLIAEFKAAWPTSAADSQVRTDKAIAALSTEELETALRRIPDFLEATKAAKRAVCGGFTYLEERRWRLLARGGAGSAAGGPVGAVAAVQCWGREWFAVLYAMAMAGKDLAAFLAHAARPGRPSWTLRASDIPGAGAVADLRPVKGDSADWQRWRAWLASKGARLERVGTGQWLFVPSGDPPVEVAAKADEAGEWARAGGMR